MTEVLTNPRREHRIPVQLVEMEFNEFILNLLPVKRRGPPYKVSRFKIFNYILMLLYMGCQWKMIPIDRDGNGRPEIHYSQIFRVFKEWVMEGVFLKIFEFSVSLLQKANLGSHYKRREKVA